MRRRRAARPRHGGRSLAGLAAAGRCAGAERRALGHLPCGGGLRVRGLCGGAAPAAPSAVVRWRSCLRPRGRDPARPARRAACALARRLCLLGLRAARRPGTTRTRTRWHRRASRPTRRRERWRRLADDDERLRPGVHRRLRRPCAGERPLGRGRRLRVPPRGGGGHARARRRRGARRADPGVRRRLRRLEPAPRDRLRGRRPQRRLDDGARARSAGACRPAPAPVRLGLGARRGCEVGRARAPAAEPAARPTSAGGGRRLPRGGVSDCHGRLPRLRNQRG